MLNLTSRQKDLIKIMINETEYRTMNDYSSLLKVSPRTIYTDIENINNYFKGKDIKIEKKPRVGIRLIGDLKTKVKITELFNEKVKEESEYTTKERQFEIIRRLLVEEEIISYQKLSDDFLVSKTSICKDMENIESDFNEKSVKIQSDKKGTKIIGTETEIQYSLKRYTDSLLDEKNVLNEKDFLVYGPNILSEVYGEKIVYVVFKEVANFEKDLKISLSYYYLKSLIITLIIFVFRLIKNKHMVFKKNFIFEEIKSLETYFIAQNTLENISKELDIRITDEDMDYLNKQLLAHSIKPKISNKEIIKKYEGIVKEAIKEMSQIMNIDLTKDNKLKESLLAHIVPMIYRLDIGVRIKNPLMNEIKKQYSVTLSATYYVMSKLEKKLDVVLTEDEVAFIMVHFQVAMDRNALVKKILIVCPTGIGSSELIANKIKRFLPAKDIIEVVPVRKIYENNINNIDLIISSVQLDIKDKPIIYVSSLVSNEDLKNISITYSNLFLDIKNEENMRKENYNFKYLKEFIDENLIFTDYNFTTKDECLEYLIKSFKDNGLTNDGFRESILDRENLGSTSLESGVAIPHAVPTTVKKSMLGIMRLNRAIKWGGKKVDTIILISISEKDIKKVKSLLSEVYEIVESRENVDNIFLNKNNAEIYETLGGR